MAWKSSLVAVRCRSGRRGSGFSRLGMSDDTALWITCCGKEFSGYRGNGSAFSVKSGCRLSALEETLDRRDQLGARGGFGNKGIDADSSASGHGFRRVVYGEEDNFGSWGDSTDFICGLNSVHHRHIDIQQDKIR